MILRKFLSRALTAVGLAALCWTACGTAWALSLGRATVLSTLGQPLHTEIELNIALDSEAESLSVDLANAQTYAAANLDYSPALKGLKATLQSRSVGNTVIRIVGDQMVNEPVVPLLLEMRWSTGKMVRSFTLFIDPPPALAPAASVPAAAASPVPQTVVVAEPIGALPPSEPPAADTASAAKAQSHTRVQAGADGAHRSMVVRKGQTARQIAASMQAPGTSLEQRMLALLRANPGAFIAGNINRLKAGAELTLEPSPDAASPSAAQAAKEVARQAAAYAAWSRKAAAAHDGIGAGHASAPSSEGRSANKKVGATPKAPTTDAGKDELKLGAAKEKDKEQAEKLAADMQAKEDAERKAELAKNIEALKETAAKTSAAAPSGAASSATSSAPDVGAAEAPAAKEPSAAPTVAAKIAEPPAAAAPASAWARLTQYLASLDQTSVAALACVGLLLLLLIYRSRSNPDSGSEADPAAENADADASHPAGQTPAGAQDAAAPAAFDAPSTQWQDTPLNQPAPHSVLFADSQLKPSDSLDALAEADVYLAYGRDVQAEEILREALGVTPNKVELHQKLLDIFVLRGDREAFAKVAQTMSTYLDSQGPQWLRVCELGALLDGSNPLYSNHAGPGSLDGEPTAAAPAFAVPLEFPAGLDLDLDKPADPAAIKPPAAGQDFRPSTQVQPLGFEFSSQNLVLAPDGKTPLDTAQPWSANAMDEGARVLEQKMDLAKEFIAVGDVAGARILLNEVMERAQGGQLEQAKQLLAQIG